MKGVESTPLTSCNPMHFMLYEEIDQGHQCTKEQVCQDFPILDCGRIRRAEGKASKSPWQSSHEIRDHEYIMPTMVVRRCHVCPPTARDCPEEASSRNNFWQGRIRLRREDIPEEDEGKSRA